MEHEIRARYRRAAFTGLASPRREPLMPIAHLRVLAILDLQPRGGAAVGAVGAGGPFSDDPFKIMLARNPEQITAALLDVIEVQQARLDGRHDPTQATLAL